ncbi:endonuclease/exonuclease/phosphatase (EEP) superfamily protein YafD [Leeuwenhoekiella aestuarii]|uniref:Endonuclease/exonuclease/phosphatase (EEP) superfamily protein YafD n=1 Tax=Leeuwenhoekiella aestuarii TaxID=2249426 RepID=A0A4Q0NXA1_9FLAO|nr:endonuclease/exonuclease/phosphatase family protein [Leeuwenhoekiella aestuarii]RXG15430.1 endonuclease/exonuclease/phosphatase (EEP) superfamily protein YafD [Leeuwenhoekiella aestuarii]RXG17463.1 endonuclease/exonuclease/phosphatase (EEP) superfamily protein YafD [Leeuwenhoekiella aestuarii]
MTFKNVLQILGGIAVVLTLVPFVAADYWWIRVFDFPHMQLTIFTAIATIAYLMKFDIKWAKDYAFMAIMIACLTLQAIKIYPYTPISPFEVLNSTEDNTESQFSVLVSNVLQKNKNHKLLLKEVKQKDPDILLLLEADTVWLNAVNNKLKEEYPFYRGAPISNTYGMLLYSKLPLINPEVHYLIDDSIPSIDAQVQLKSGDKIQLYAIHPTPPMPQHNTRSTDRDAEMMKTAFKSRKSKLPVLVIGDFNDVAWSESTELFKEVSELLDLRIGRGLFNTFSADSNIMRWPLDHIFVSEHFRAVEVLRGYDIDSDHFPAYAKLSLEPEGKDYQLPKLPTESQLKNAYEIIEKEATQKDTKQ